MKFVNIMGNVDDIDRVITKYVSKYEIQLENAAQEFSNERHIKPFSETNNYNNVLKTAEKFMGLIKEPQSVKLMEMEPKEATDIVNRMSEQMENIAQEKEYLIKEKDRLQEIKNSLEPFMDLNFDLKKLLKFEFIKFRFGKMPRASFKKFEAYIDEMETFFVTSKITADYVWGVYFTTEKLGKTVDPLFASLHFERIYVSDEVEGTPKEAAAKITEEILSIDNQVNKITQKQILELAGNRNEIVSAYYTLERLNKSFAVKKFAAQIKSTNTDTYVIAGWMAEEDALELQKKLAEDERVIYIVEDENSGIRSKPPTKLKNPKLFQPFEMFTKMYGMPAYGEFDPTIFIALTYTFIFGMMFGDVGQGLVILIGGFILYKLKKMNLAAIMSMAAIFSIIFGFMYGSIFGFEEAIPALWVKPMEQTNTVLITAVAFGVCLIIIAMIINIINKLKIGKVSEALFDTNGISGLLFYVIVLASALMMLFGGIKIATWVLALAIGIPLILTMFREPIGRFLEHKKELIQGKKGQYFLETFFEMFEVLLSYVTNTISFVRVGAFALSHAGMMNVVHMLANGNIVVLVLGNILVMGLEGLVVGIQVLRLEYYEMFSRFYNASGKEFKTTVEAVEHKTF